MKNIKSKDIRTQTSLCESSARILLIEEQLELLSAATLAGIHTLTHCGNIIPETADMWQAGEHLNTVALCDRSLQGPQEIIQDHSADHGKISHSYVITDKVCLTSSCRPPRSCIHSNLFPCLPLPQFRSTWVLLSMDGTCTTSTTNRRKLIFV